MNNIKHFLKIASLTGMLAATTILSASTAIEPTAPLFGFIQPGIFSKIDLSDGDADAFLPWYAVGYKTGNLYGASVDSNGKTDIANATWNAAALLDNRDQDKRYIVTMGVTSTGTKVVIPFTKDALEKLNKPRFQALFDDKDEDKKVKFIRGDQGEEDDKFRTRPSVLGDIVGSNPVYVGAPNARYLETSYLTYYANNANRKGRVYVGANDGMLHAFDAFNGNETFAYIPFTVSPNLSKLVTYNHNEVSVHNKYVDGPLATGETKLSNGSWATVLVGTLGSGGKGVFALNVTSDAEISKEDNTDIGAGKRVMWEKNSDSTAMGNLGYTHAGAEIVQLNNGDWAAVIGNGYGSDTGVASLMILNINDGSLIAEIEVPDDAANGLSTPTTVDIGDDGKVDYAYAGDLNGNLWKFDLTSTTSGGWKVDYTNNPLYAPVAGEKNVVDNSDFIKQSITTKPIIAFHPNGKSAGYMVYFGTGRLLATSDQSNKTRHHVHGIWDSPTWALKSTTTVKGETVTTGQIPIRKSDLLEQIMLEIIHQDGVNTARIISDKRPSWDAGYVGTDTHLGWITPLDPKNIHDSRAGARLLQEVSILDKSLQFVTNNPTRPDNDGENWWYQIDRRNGGSAKRLTFDTNADGVFNATHDLDETVDDRVKFTINDPDFVADPDDPGASPTQIDIFKFPSAINIGKGFAARPSFGIVNNQLVAALINRLFRPSFLAEDGVTPLPGNEDFGLIGGHMDLDVSSQTYPAPGGKTDEHKHKWDDVYGPIVDFMEIPGKHRSVDDTAGSPSSLPGSQRDKFFIVTVANAHLSPGGILNINGEKIPVKDYRARMKRWLAGGGSSTFTDKLGNTEEQFRVYKLNAVSPISAEYLNGVRQLESQDYSSFPGGEPPVPLPTESRSFRMEFDRGALGVGGLVGTNTGCVKGNATSHDGEYRNGALTTQLLDVTNMVDATGKLVNAYAEDATTKEWWPLDASTGLINKNLGPGIHRLGHALPKNGFTAANHVNGDGMMWESTLFHHWSGKCYTDKLYQTNYDKDFERVTGDEFVIQYDADIGLDYYTIDDDVDDTTTCTVNCDDDDTTTVVDPELPIYDTLPDLADEDKCASDQSDCLIPKQDDTFADFESQRLYWREFVPDQ